MIFFLSLAILLYSRDATDNKQEHLGVRYVTIYKERHIGQNFKNLLKYFPVSNISVILAQAFHYQRPLSCPSPPSKRELCFLVAGVMKHLVNNSLTQI